MKTIFEKSNGVEGIGFGSNTVLGDYLPQEILRVYNEDLVLVGWFPIEEETKCQIYCYIYGFTYKKVKIS